MWYNLYYKKNENLFKLNPLNYHARFKEQEEFYKLSVASELLKNIKPIIKYFKMRRKNAILSNLESIERSVEFIANMYEGNRYVRNMHNEMMKAAKKSLSYNNVKYILKTYNAYFAEDYEKKQQV
jgi:hypothetical protein